MAKYVFYSGSFSNVIHVMVYDAGKKEMEYIKGLPHDRASFITTDQKQQRLYVGCEKFGAKGSIGVYDISDPLNPILMQEYEQNAQGSAYLSLGSDEKFLLACGYFSGDVEVYCLNEDGTVGDLCFESFYKTYGKAFPKGSYGQAVPRAHCIMQVPGSRFVLVTDYSGDRLVCYELQEDGNMKEISAFYTEKGDAPRHLAVHPVYSDIIYMNAEFSPSVYVLKIHLQTGELTFVNKETVVREDKIGMSSAVKVSKDGKYLYNGSRNNEELAVFEIHAKGQGLSYVGAVPDLGYIRDFIFDPENEVLITGNQATHILQGFQMNWNNGMCAPLSFKIPAGTPGSFVFVQKPVYQ